MKKPDFIIIGFPRCGTTALTRNLTMHRDAFCLMTVGSESHFFFRHNEDKHIYVPEREVKEYESQFPDEKICGEKNPMYIWSDHALKTIKRNYKDIKLIVCLRSPIDAYLSLYRLKVRQWKEGCSYGIDGDTYPIEDIILKDMDVSNLLCTNYCYVNYIALVLSMFRREQVHFVIQERMFKNQKEEFGKVLDFVGLFRLSMRLNEPVATSAQDIVPSPRFLLAIDKLLALYKEDIRILRLMLNDSISEWDERDSYYRYLRTVQVNNKYELQDRVQA